LHRPIIDYALTAFSVTLKLENILGMNPKLSRGTSRVTDLPSQIRRRKDEPMKAKSGYKKQKTETSTGKWLKRYFLKRTCRRRGAAPPTTNLDRQIILKNNKVAQGPDKDILPVSLNAHIVQK